MFVRITTNHVEVSSGKVGRPYLCTWYVLDETCIDTFPSIMENEE